MIQRSRPYGDSARTSLIVVGELEEIVVPAGKFQALRITATKNEGDSKTVMSQTWVVDAVGVVKLEADGATQTLKSFTAGKDK